MMRFRSGNNIAYSRAFFHLKCTNPAEVSAGMTRVCQRWLTHSLIHLLRYAASLSK